MAVSQQNVCGWSRQMPCTMYIRIKNAISAGGRGGVRRWGEGLRVSERLVGGVSMVSGWGCGERLGVGRLWNWGRVWITQHVEQILSFDLLASLF